MGGASLTIRVVADGRGPIGKIFAGLAECRHILYRTYRCPVFSARSHLPVLRTWRACGHVEGDILLSLTRTCTNMTTSKYYMYMYNCGIFFFRTYLFVRALFGKSPPTHEGHPEPMVEVWARSEHCSSRGVRSKFFFGWEWIRRFPGVSVQCIFIFIVHFGGEIMTKRQATAAAAAAVHRACYNQLATTLQRYRAQQQQATPCACDRSALYCVELLWKAREIRHPSHLLVPIISRLLFLFCFVRHKTQIQPHTTNNSSSAKSTLQPASLSRPAAAGNAMRV